MQQLLVTDLARSITPLPSFLATRVSGKRFWELLRPRITSSNPGEFITLSFAGIDLMDGSFADEAFATWASLRGRREAEFYPVLLSDLNDTCRDNLEMALNTRPDRESKHLERLRNCVFPVINNAEVILLGKYEENVAETFELLRRHKTLTARELADRMNLNLNAASTRLKTLSDLGLSLRSSVHDSQGKQYTYHTWE
ncbi:MAG TPA: hypothetical protein VKQ72_07760 [Aggregatilineales bacterium]|nr:hypothetical protein [Aggregatilineales bacterium]